MDDIALGAEELEVHVLADDRPLQAQRCVLDLDAAKEPLTRLTDPHPPGKARTTVDVLQIHIAAAHPDRLGSRTGDGPSGPADAPPETAKSGALRRPPTTRFRLAGS